MSFEIELQHEGRGRRADYVFGVDPLGWGAFDVVRFHAVEAISQPYEVTLDLVRRAEQGPVELEPLLGAGCTLRIASEARFRPIHGVVEEIAELDRTSSLFLYRVRISPPFARAKSASAAAAGCTSRSARSSPISSRTGRTVSRPDTAAS